MTNKRRYDLDWLRVIAIAAVFIHHIGMPFNGDGFHIMNSDSSKLLDDSMVFFEQFRLPLLFLISGTGTLFAFSKRTWIQFAKERSLRLVIPLIFGILFVVPPQTYYEHIANDRSYFDIYKEGAFETNHLWFIENLFILSMLFIPIILFLKSSSSNSMIQVVDRIISKKYGMLLGVLPLLFITLVLKKWFPADSKDITNLSSTFYYGYFFLTGMLLVRSKNSWRNLVKFRRFHLVVFLISSVLFYGYYLLPNEIIAPHVSIANRWNLWYVVCGLVGWTLVVTVLGYARVWLNRPSTLLQKCNEAIYPFYVLHQTIIVIVGYYVIQLEVGIPSKIILLMVTSFPIILLIYRYLIYPFNLPRLLFGMKKKKSIVR